jgi:plasmid stabilization system protein ParE
MPYSYIILAAAQEEYESSVIWYNEKSPPAAARFAEAIDNTLNLICNHPNRWRSEHKNYHELAVKNYPFSIVYTIDAAKELVVVGSIYHHSRNPKKKYKK